MSAISASCGKLASCCSARAVTIFLFHLSCNSALKARSWLHNNSLRGLLLSSAGKGCGFRTSTCFYTLGSVPTLTLKNRSEPFFWATGPALGRSYGKNKISRLAKRNSASSERFGLCVYIYICRYIRTGKWTDRHIDSQTGRQMDRQADRQTDRQTHKQLHRWTGR